MANRIYRSVNMASASSYSERPMLPSTCRYWTLLHLVPFLLIPLVTSPLAVVTGINVAAGVTHIIVIVVLSVGQGVLSRGEPCSPIRWTWQSACGFAGALAVGLVVMSTVDLAGHDQLATIAGMTASGAVLGAAQAPLRPAGRLSWFVASTVGWLVGALAFRGILPYLLRASVTGTSLYAPAYNAGHNELLWAATGIAFYGFFTGALRRFWGVEPRTRVSPSPSDAV